MKDGLGRKVVKRIALFCYLTDLRISRWWKRKRGFKPRYVLKGDCNGCGLCCQSPTIRTTRAVAWTFLRRIFLYWQKVVNGFVLEKEDRESGVFTFRCTHYDPKTKLCDSYESRPGMCRDYPHNLIYEGYPHFFPECSYFAVDTKAEQFNKSLDQVQKKLGLSADKMEELRQKLHLKDGNTE